MLESRHMEDGADECFTKWTAARFEARLNELDLGPAYARAWAYVARLDDESRPDPPTLGDWLGRAEPPRLPGFVEAHLQLAAPRAAERRLERLCAAHEDRLQRAYERYCPHELRDPTPSPQKQETFLAAHQPTQETDERPEAPIIEERPSYEPIPVYEPTPERPSVHASETSPEYQRVRTPAPSPVPEDQESSLGDSGPSPTQGAFRHEEVESDEDSDDSEIAGARHFTDLPHIWQSAQQQRAKRRRTLSSKPET